MFPPACVCVCAHIHLLLNYLIQPHFDDVMFFKLTRTKRNERPCFVATAAGRAVAEGIPLLGGEAASALLRVFKVLGVKNTFDRHKCCCRANHGRDSVFVGVKWKYERYNLWTIVF